MLPDQVAMGIGHALFLADPDDPKVKAMDIFEPAEATCQPADTEDAAKGELAFHHVMIFIIM